MKRTLRRLLGIRELMEDLAQGGFERMNAEMRFLKGAAERQEQIGRRIRAEAVRDLTEDPVAARDAWQLQRADGEVAGWKKTRLDALAEEAKPGLDRAREELLARRVERRQVETLHAAAMDAEEKVQIRRDQNRTDDWFQSRPGARDRTRK